MNIIINLYLREIINGELKVKRKLVRILIGLEILLEKHLMNGLGGTLLG